MPYYFFKEPSRGLHWNLVFVASSYEVARERQRELRREEQARGFVTHVVYAESEAEALRQHRRVLHYPNIREVQRASLGRM